MPTDRSNANGIRTTARLRLRPWKDADRVPFAAMNADPDVMRHFPRPFTADESDRFIDDNAHRLATRGWGNWAVETRADDTFIGFVGLSVPADWHPCAGSIEIGWRLAPTHWGRGFATEAGRRVLELAFDTFELPEIISYTARTNAASIAVMRKLGLRDDGTGFEHPRIDAGHPLRAHVVYRLARTDARH